MINVRIMQDDVSLVSVEASCLKNTVRLGSLGLMAGKLMLLLKDVCYRS